MTTRITRTERDPYTGDKLPPEPITRGDVYGYPERPGVRRQPISATRCG